MFSLIRPYIFSLDPEAAHDLAIKSLKFNILPKKAIGQDYKLKRNAFRSYRSEDESIHNHKIVESLLS